MIEEVQARSRAYALFSRLYLRGLTPDVLLSVRVIPELAACLADPFDDDEAAADHYQLFSLDVFPYASVFLDEGARPGGVVTDAIRRHFARAGWMPDSDSESADHLGHELALLAHLTAAEAEAWEDGAEKEARRMQKLQQQFLHEHLCGWLPPFVQAVRQQGHPFYTVLADFTLDLVLDHRQAGSNERFVLPTPPDVLAEERSSLKDIASFLTTPAWSGLYLSRSDIARLGRAERLPRGFGSRVQMLANLLRAAVEYDRTGPMLAALHHHLQTWQQGYQDLLETEVPGIGEIAAVWMARLVATERLISQMQEAAKTSAH